ncbi:MAG: hypothetical protein AAF998_25745 [Bacteroidota bacterium]
MIESLCENCGEKFETTSHRAKYCSTSCKQQAYRSRQENKVPPDEYLNHPEDPDWDEQEEEWKEELPNDQSEWEGNHGDYPDGLGAESGYRNAETGHYEKNGLSYGKNDDCYGRNSDDHRNNGTVRYGKSDPRYGKIGSERYDSSQPGYDRNDLHRNASHDPEPDERRRYPLHFYAPNGMFTAQALAQLPRLDQLALKHKPARYSDETWFEFLQSIDGIPVDIYAEARIELEEEQQQAAIAEMNARIVRWFPRLLEFAHADEVELETVERLLMRMRSFVRSDRFRLIPADHTHRLELLYELDVFSGLVEDQRDQGYESMALNPTDAFLERMDRVIAAARRA